MNTTSINYGYKNMVSWKLEGDHYFNLITSHEELIISSSWGCFFHRGKLNWDREDLFECFKSGHDVPDKYLRDVILPKIRLYFLIEKKDTKVSFGGTEVVTQHKKLLSFIHNIFNMNTLFTSDDSLFCNLADLMTKNSLIDQKVEEFMIYRLVNTLHIDFPKSYFNEPLKVVLPFIKKQMKENTRENYIITPDYFMNIKGIRPKGENDFYRPSWCFSQRDFLGYRDVVEKYHVDGKNEATDLSILDKEMEVVFVDDTTVTLKNNQQCCNFIDFIAQFYTVGDDLSQMKRWLRV